MLSSLSFPSSHVTIFTLQRSFLLSAAPGAEVLLRYSRRLFEVPGALSVCLCLCVWKLFPLLSGAAEHLALLLIWSPHNVETTFHVCVLLQRCIVSLHYAKPRKPETVSAIFIAFIYDKKRQFKGRVVLKECSVG